MNWLDKHRKKLFGLGFFILGFIFGIIFVAFNEFLNQNILFWILIPLGLGFIILLVYIGLIYIFKKKK